MSQDELARLEADLTALDSAWATKRDELLEKYQVVGKGRPKLRRGTGWAGFGMALIIIPIILFLIVESFIWVLIPIGVVMVLIGYWEFSHASRFENAFKQYEEERQKTADSLSQRQTEMGITPKWSKRARADRAKNNA